MFEVLTAFLERAHADRGVVERSFQQDTRSRRIGHTARRDHRADECLASFRQAEIAVRQDFLAGVGGDASACSHSTQPRFGRPRKLFLAYRVYGR